MNFDYPHAVRFLCIECGKCCGDTKQKTRHVLLLKTEAEQISATTLRLISDFAVKIKGKAPYSYEMRKTAEDGQCIFLENNHCSIYSLRPLICRFYPFELKNSENQRYEFLFTAECPGINKGKMLNENYFRKLFRLARVKSSQT
jgi:Fe-S-cluster containining protein